MNTIINATPHAISLANAAGEIVSTFAPSGTLARIASTDIEVGEVAGVPVVRTQFGALEGLPEPQDGTVYIVSALVLGASAGRTDLVAPDTGPTAVRREGQVVAVRRWRTA